MKTFDDFMDHIATSAIAGAVIHVLVGFGILALVLLAAPALGNHNQPEPLFLKVKSACLDQEVVIRLVTSQDIEKRQKMYEAALAAKVCKNFTNWFSVVAHEVVAELVWGGDGEETKMVVVKLFDINGFPIYSWFSVERWDIWTGGYFKPIGLQI